jgi:hypothetical protein
MKAVVVYESLWGNTGLIARAIAEGIGPDAVALHTNEAPADAVASADLLVCGAPLLGFSLPTEQMRENIRTTKDVKQPPADLANKSMRSWLGDLPDGAGRAAGFETAIWWSPGSAAKTIDRQLVAKGRSSAGKPQRFVVTGRYGPLSDGELERARAWGTRLAG